MLLRSAYSRTVLPDRFHDRAFLEEYGRLESLRAARYNTAFSVVLILLEWPGPDAPDGAARPHSARELLAGTVSSAIVDSIRDCDIVGLGEDGAVVCLLPETDYFGTLVAIRKIGIALAALGKKHPEVSVTLSHATFPGGGRSYADLIIHAGRLAEEKKASPWETRAMGRMLFWEIISDFYRGDIKGLSSTCFDAGAGHSLPGSVIDRLYEQVINEISRAPHRKGIVYINPRNADSLKRLAARLEASTKTRAKVFMVTRGADSNREIKNAFNSPIDDERLAETSFIFYLSEDSGYALVCRENWGASFSCFHTSDACVVEGLITKFQIEYSLQVQLG